MKSSRRIKRTPKWNELPLRVSRPGKSAIKVPGDSTSNEGILDDAFLTESSHGGRQQVSEASCIRAPIQDHLWTTLAFHHNNCDTGETETPGALST